MKKPYGLILAGLLLLFLGGSLSGTGKVKVAQIKYWGATKKGTQTGYRYTTDEVWPVYRRILTGDFAGATDDEGNSIEHLSIYERSLERGKGKSIWKYILTDLDRDGTEDLFIQLCPFPYSPGFGCEEKLLTDDDCFTEFLAVPGVYRFSHESAAFTCKNGKAVMLWLDDTGLNSFEVELRNGGYLYVDCYAALASVSLCNHGRGSECAIYQMLTVDYSWMDREWYDSTYGDYSFEGEGVYYFRQDYKDGEPAAKPVRLSRQQWHALEGEIGELLILENEWRSAADL